MRTPTLATKGALCLAPLVALLLGCGGHHHHAKRVVGDARLIVMWPEGRANPYAAKVHNLEVTLLSGAKAVATQDVVRPNQLAPFTELPAGDYKMDIRARETEDTSGPIVTGVGIPLSVSDQEGVSVYFSMVNDPVRIDVSPSSLTLEALSQGELTLTARDAAGNYTFGNPDGLVLASSDPDVATSDFTGVVTTGAKGGTTTLSFTDTSIGKSATATVNVLPPQTLSLSPSQTTLAPTGSARFGATLSGRPAPALRWSVAEGNIGGRIDANGRYTAPARSGLFHVVATGVSNPKLNASALVVVGSGTLGATVH